ncbi:MAG: creatininase family protein [Acetobacteraceae bacterium]|nr:creatininase family protein [Acetobacteraceae bacterium]
MATEIRWERMTAPELKTLAADPEALVVLPVGSLEQHGPHLPVWTDSFCAHAFATRAAEAAGIPVAVLPPMWMGLSEHHFPFGGTISLDHATFHAVLRCVVRSIMADGFRRLLIVNGHGGNIEPLAVSVREMAHEFGVPIVTTTWPMAAAQAIGAILTTQPGVQHACEGETSLWLALDAAQVRMARIADSLSNPVPNPPAGFSRFWSFEERAPRTGVRGDPRAATAEKGEAILAAVVEALVRAMRDPALWSLPDPVWQAGRAAAQ